MRQNNHWILLFLSLMRFALSFITWSGQKFYWSDQKNAGAFFSDMLVTRLSATDTGNSTTILMRKSFECRQIFYSKLFPKIQFYLKFSHFLKPNPSKVALSFNIKIVTFNQSFKLKEKGSRLLKLFTSNWGTKKNVFLSSMYWNVYRNLNSSAIKFLIIEILKYWL